MQLAIGPLIAVLLVISFLQVNGLDHGPWTYNIAHTLIFVVCIQLILPMVLIVFMRLLSVPAEWQAAFALVAAASFIAGGPTVVMMLGGDGVIALRLLVVSTLALPLTSFPVLALLEFHSSFAMLMRTTMVLTIVVVGSALVAQLIRNYLLGAHSVVQRQCLDGLSALILALLVLGLMAAIHTTWDNPRLLLVTLMAAFAINFSLQFVGLALNYLFSINTPIVLGVLTGNRAIAIFLTALPASSFEPLLLFIACYQIPMYLTPLLGSFIYKRFSDHAT